ncbi:hypothetical protein [Nocardioides panaciterrulae]|uniref:Putative peptide zinc metalloprotease protein n=1 Tax=Nocardioides panaciterrulae TaxID=661492 RepID=A0A7Y9E380_9ACTN|nr:hypothetical protein [Nocardioides panaciterrulae]NYD40383.1 putative peptide zinc metalloprotease protein [Nocardioides panaciterrulae]
MTTTGGRGDLVEPGPGAAPGPGDDAERPPARADGVQLMGEMPGSGYRTPPALARRADGQVVQLTPLLYLLLSALDGRRGHDELAAHLSKATGRGVSGANVAQLTTKLRSLGLAASPDGSPPELRRSNPLLALRFKAVVSDPERTRRLTAPFARLFHPLLVALVLAVFAWISWWVLFDRGLASATHDAFARPGLLLVVLAVTVLSAGFHEFGHAAAARRGGATPGVMGVGLYLIWPAFYTDVTDSYRLGRGGRLRTDLGGLYFNALVVVGTAAVWWVSRDDAILLLVATQVLQMLHQLLPLVRFDGYHVLADVTGVPDLFQRIGPTLRGLLPWRRRDPQARMLKPWARAVVSAWVLVVVPVLALTLLVLVTTFPRIVGSALASSRLQWGTLQAAFGDGDLLAVAAHAVAALVVLLPPLAMAVALFRVGRRLARAVWTRTAGHPVRRGLALLVAAALAAGLVWSWWPSPERYRPVQAYEGGTLGDALALARPATGFGAGTEGRAAVYLRPGQAPPTREHPMLAVVLVPHDGPASGQTAGLPDGAGAADAGASSVAPGTWVFPIEPPAAPGEGDTQAVAVNTTDGTTVYDTAFALVWADPNTPVDNTNEAFALASCRDCAAVAVSFQVVLVTGQADVAVPQNLSVSATDGCVGCLSYALAVQLFVTLDGPLSDGANAKLDDLWQQIARFGDHVEDVPLSEIRAQLTDFETQILAIIEEDQPTVTDPGTATDPSASASASPSTSPSADPSSSADPSGSASPTATVPATSGATASGSPSGVPDPTGSTSASPGVSPSTSPSPSSTAASPTPSGSTTSASPTASPS